MSLRTRIIACLDVKHGRVVKGVNFINLTDEGDPVELAARYAEEGMDEIVYLDIAASPEGRPALLDVVRRTAENVFVPLTVGGGVRKPADMRAVLRAGADKVSLNTAAVLRPDLLDECAAAFGNQCVVLAIDAQVMPGGSWNTFITGGGTTPVSTRWSGRWKESRAGPGRSCSHRWTATAPISGSMWNCSA